MSYSQSTLGCWRALTSAFPLAPPVIILNGESFLLPGTLRLRKGHVHEQSSLTCAPACTTAHGIASLVSSVFSAYVPGAVGRRLVLFKFKGIVAFPVEQRETSQGSERTRNFSQPHRTFYLHSPEAAGTVEVSIAAGAAQGGILIADAAPGELLFLCLLPGGLGLRLLGAERSGGREVCRNTAAGAVGQGREEGVAVAWGFSHLGLCPIGLGLGSESWLHGDVQATCLIQGSFFSELWTGRRRSASCSRPRLCPPAPRVFLCSVALASQPISHDLLPMAADTPSQGASRQVWVIGTVECQVEQELQSGHSVRE